MSNAPTAPAERFAMIVEEFLSNPAVTPPSGKGFGSSGLRVDGKIFAMLSSKGEFVVKLPQQRVDALIAAGAGRRFDIGHQRVMKQWFVVEATATDEWRPLAQEALEFVSSHSL